MRACEDQRLRSDRDPDGEEEQPDEQGRKAREQ